MTPSYLLLPVVFTFVMAFFYLSRGERPISAATFSVALLWLGILGAWTTAVFRAQEKRIKALERRVSQIQRE